MGLEYYGGEANPFEREPDPSEQPRFFECFQCPAKLINVGKVNPEEKRFICIIFDVENLKTFLENQAIINPALRKPLRRCPYHTDVEPDNELPPLQVPTNNS